METSCLAILVFCFLIKQVALVFFLCPSDPNIKLVYLNGGQQ